MESEAEAQVKQGRQATPESSGALGMAVMEKPVVQAPIHPGNSSAKGIVRRFPPWLPAYSHAQRGSYTSIDPLEVSTLY